jgi:RNA polymerase sigma-70 factor (ECF subfamily)
MPALAPDEIDQAVARGRAAWPAVTVPAEALAAFLTDGAGLAHAEDLYLACACARGDAAAIGAFEAQVLPRIAAPLRRIAITDDVVAEVRQRLREHLLVGDPPRIAEYRGRGPLTAWVRIVAVRMALQLMRRARADERRVEVLGHEPEPPRLDPALELLRARHQGTFRAAFTAALAELTPHQRNLLQLHLLEDLSLAEIATLHGVSKSSAARWLAQARASLDEGIRHRLRAELRLGEPELDSLIVALQSRLDLSVERLLAGDEVQGHG